MATLDSALNKWVDAVPEECAPPHSSACKRGTLIFRPLSVRLDSKVSKKCRAGVIQSVFLWTQFYEIQLHIHRMFALRELSDPELSTSSMIICKNASKQCIAAMESAKDVMMAPFHCFLLIVSFGFGYYCADAQRFPSLIEICVYIDGFPSLDVLEEKADRPRLPGIFGHQCRGGYGWTNGRKVPHFS